MSPDSVIYEKKNSEKHFCIIMSYDPKNRLLFGNFVNRVLLPPFFLGLLCLGFIEYFDTRLPPWPLEENIEF